MLLLAAQYDRFNATLGARIGSYPWHCLIGSLVIACLLSIGISRMQLEKDVRRSFAPRHSRALRETEVYLRFYGLAIYPQRAFLLIYAKDNGTMLRPEYMAEVSRLDAYVISRLQTTAADGRRSCEPMCRLNHAFYAFQMGLQVQQDRLDHNQSLNTEISLDFPTARLYGNEIFLGMNLFGVEIDSVSNDQQRPTSIRHVQTVILWYFSNLDHIDERRQMQTSMLELFELSKLANYSSLIDFHIFGDEIANSEMMRGAQQATELMLIGFSFLLLFVLFVVSRQPFENRRSVVYVVLATVICPLLSAASAFGVLSWITQIHSVMCVTPFLVVGIGVDDAFIIIHAWHRIRRLNVDMPSDMLLSRVFREVGPSITITSVTNMIAFGIGGLTSTPQMSLFCTCTSLAVAFDFLFTFTMFAPVLVLCSSRSEHRPIPPPSSSSSIVPQKIETDQSFIAKYSLFVVGWPARILTIVILFALYLSSAFGVALMKTTFEPAKAFPSDSPLATSLQMVRAVFDEFFPMKVIVERPPNISDPVDYARFYAMVDALESLPQSYGRKRTVLWLEQYERFDREAFETIASLGFADNDANYTLSYENVPLFIENLPHQAINIRYNMTTSIWKKQPIVQMNSFTFTTINNGMAEWWARARFLDEYRQILDQFSEFQATVFDGDATVLDLILTVKNDLFGSITVTVLCMGAVCLFFIPSRVGVLLVTFVITSICFSLLGLLSWWGADMDPVTMVDVVISTGFSVDYTAHIAYHFYKSSPTDAVDSSSAQSLSVHNRIGAALGEMARPMLEAGISTALCMLPLIFVPTYAIVAFAKTIFIVVSIGLLHGLFLLPVLLTSLSMLRPQKKRSTKSLLLNQPLI